MVLAGPCERVPFGFAPIIVNSPTGRTQPCMLHGVQCRVERALFHNEEPVGNPPDVHHDPIPVHGTKLRESLEDQEIERPGSRVTTKHKPHFFLLASNSPTKPSRPGSPADPSYSSPGE